MKNRTGFVVTILMMTLGANSALASTPGLDQRQLNQEDRIAHGIRSGELTKGEAGRLIQGQAELQRMENRTRQDGTVTNGERARLHHKANMESGKIHRNKHDDSRRRGR